jgi:hypothetical protein
MRQLEKTMTGFGWIIETFQDMTVCCFFDGIQAAGGAILVVPAWRSLLDLPESAD